MRRIFALINRATNEPDGCVSTHLDHLEDFDYNRETHELVVVPKNHPVFNEQRAWTAPRREVFGARWDRQLIRKPQEQIDAEKAEREVRRQRPGKGMIEVLLDLINEERLSNGKAMLTMDDVQALRKQP